MERYSSEAVELRAESDASYLMGYGVELLPHTQLPVPASLPEEQANASELVKGYMSGRVFGELFLLRGSVSMSSTLLLREGPFLGGLYGPKVYGRIALDMTPDVSIILGVPRSRNRDEAPTFQYVEIPVEGLTTGRLLIGLDPQKYARQLGIAEETDSFFSIPAVDLSPESTENSSVKTNKVSRLQAVISYSQRSRGGLVIYSVGLHDIVAGVVGRDSTINAVGGGAVPVQRGEPTIKKRSLAAD